MHIIKHYAISIAHSLENFNSLFFTNLKDHAKFSLDLCLFNSFIGDENDKKIFNTLTIVIFILFFCN